MKKKYTFIFLLLLSFSFLNAQITDFITGISTTKIIIDGDYLFYISEPQSTIYRTDISDLAFPTTLPLHTDDGDILRSMVGLAKNGDDLYYGLFNPISALGGIRRINLSDLGAGATELNTTAGFDLAFNSNTIYSVASTIYVHVRSTNTLLTPPVTPITYETGDVYNCLYNEGFTLYMGTSDGKIYTKNLLTGALKSLLYTSASANRIDEILKFDGLLYFSDSDGVHRFNPLDPSPVTQTIADDSEFTDYAIGMAAKSYPSGDNYLFVSDLGTKIIKIDLNHPTLSIKGTSANASIVFPNPTLNTVTIKTSSDIEEISVFDVLGKRVFKTLLINETLEYNLNLLRLNAGIYNLQIKTSKGVLSKKIIKQ